MIFAGMMLAMGAAVLSQGDYQVLFNDCPHCTAQFHVAPDGKTAYVNRERVSDAEVDAVAKRALALMKSTEDAKKFNEKRPLMGWSSWNTFGAQITADVVTTMAEAMATNGLKDAGYRYVNIDDGYYVDRDAKGNLRIDPVKFPNGLKPVVDRIHGLGMKAGIYSDAGDNTCCGIHGVGLYGHDDQDAQFLFKEMDFDFIKIDYCGGCHLKLNEHDRYTAIRRALDKAKPGVRMNICRWNFPGEWAAKVADSWRSTGDIRAKWADVKRIVDQTIPLAAFASYGHYNDMDMLEVGQLCGKVRTAFGACDPGLTRVEEATHFGMWCFMSSPLLLGCDARKLDATTMALVTNPFLLAMNQNDLDAPVRMILRDEDSYILAKDCEKLRGTSRYVAIYNARETDYEFCIEFYQLDLGGKLRFFDLGAREDAGTYERNARFVVPPHGARFFRVDADVRY